MPHDPSSRPGDGPAHDAAVEFDAVMLDPADISDSDSDGILPLSAEALAAARRWLEPTKYDADDSEFARHRASHLEGTGRWLLNSGVYNEWRSSTEHGLLWIRGIPGSGKSVIAATLIDQLRQEGVPVLYFFFRQIIDANHSPVAALRDWLDQILISSPPLQLVLEEYLDAKRSLESVLAADLWRHLRLALSQLPRAYVVVDALDEMDRGDKMEAFIHRLAELGHWRPSQVKVIITSRPVQYVEDPLRAARAHHLRLEERLVDVDISAYVRHRLSVSPIAEEYHESINDALPGRAKGLFLYAKLAMDALVEPDADTQQVLRDLPSNLSDMYADLLQEHARRTNIPADIQLLILQFVTHANRPLRLLELSEMINVTQYPQEQRDLKATKDLVRTACGPLLEILPSETVCVVHHSLTEFLTGETRRSAQHDYPVLEFGPTHNRLAEICLSYLQSTGLGELELEPDFGLFLPPSHTGLSSVFTRYAGLNWFVHVRKATLMGVDQSNINRLLDTLFAGESLERVIALTDEQDLDENSNHAAKNTPPLLASIALRLDQYTRTLLSRPGVQINGQQGMRWGPLAYAASKGYVDIVELLLQHGADPMDRDTWATSHATALHHAAAQNHPEIVTILLNAGADPLVTDLKSDGSDGYGVAKRAALESACRGGHVEAVAAFLPFLKTAEGLTAALFWALENLSHPDVVELLVDHPLVQVNSVGPSQFSSPLMLACGHRDARSVRCLIAAGADPNQLHQGRWVPFGKAGRGFTALHTWSAGTENPDPRYPCHADQKVDTEATRECFRQLVSAGANLDQRDPNGNTPLLLASDLVAVRLLVDAGADPNAVNNRGETLLHHTRDKAIVRFLLEEAKASNNMRTRSDPPLLKFLKNGQVENALVLLDCGADATVMDKSGNGAFHHAACLGKYVQGKEDLGGQLIEVLLSAGADVNLKNKKGQTPVHQFGNDRPDSSEGDSDTILRAMVAAGADLEARDNEGQTPLWAMIKKYPYLRPKRRVMYEKMIAAGAILDTRDYCGRSLVHVAAEHADMNLLPWLVSRGIDCKATDHKGNTVVHGLMLRANQSSYGRDPHSLRCFDDFISLGVDPTQPNNAGRTPLHAISATRPCLDTQMSNRPDHKSTAFDCILALLPETINRADNAGVTPLHLTATFSEYQSKRLLEAGADPSIATHEGMTAFHLAARNRQPNIIGRLLDALELRVSREAMKPILNFQAGYRQTALSLACASGTVESVKLLIEAGAGVDGDYLDMAVEGCATFEEEQANWPRHKVAGRSLLDAGSVNVDGTHRTKLGWEDSRYPITRLDEILALVASYAPSVISIDSAVRRAAGFGSDYTVDRLLRIRSGLSPERPFKFSHESFASLARREAIRRAYECGVPDNVSPESRWGHAESELNYLMLIREYGLVRDRLSEDDSLKTQDRRRTVVHELTGGGFASLLAELLTPALLKKLDGPMPSQARRVGDVTLSETPEPLLITACQRETPNMDVVRLLVERFNIDVNKENECRQRGHDLLRTVPKTALHALAIGTYWWQTAQAIPYLVERGADLEARDSRGCTPLNAALDNLVENLGFNMRAVKTLVELGADVNSADNNGVSCLARASSDKDVTEFLLSRGATVGPKALFTALEKSNIEMLEVLLLHGADPNGRTPSSKTKLEQTWNRGSCRHSSGLVRDELYPLHYVAACRESREGRDVLEKMIRLLLKHGADPNARYQDTTIAHQVIGNGTFAELFLQLPTLDIEATDSDGATLFLAACHNAGQVSKDSSRTREQSPPAILLARGADIHACDKAGRTALHRVLSIALDREDPDTLRRLVTEPNLVNQPDKKGQTPIHFATRRFRHAVREVDVLLAAGADPWISDGDGNTLLHTVFRDGIWRQKEKERPDGDNDGPGEMWCDVLERVLGLAGAQAFVNARNHAGETPVFGYFLGSAGRPRGLGTVNKATSQYSEPAFAVFDAVGVDWDVANNKDQTLLHLVAESSIGRFKFLLSKGLDPRAEDAMHQTPLDVAAAAGFEDILALFEKRTTTLDTSVGKKPSKGNAGFKLGT